MYNLWWVSITNAFKSFGHGNLTAKHCCFGCSRPSDADEIKLFEKDDQATKH